MLWAAASDVNGHEATVVGHRARYRRVRMRQRWFGGRCCIIEPIFELNWPPVAESGTRSERIDLAHRCFISGQDDQVRGQREIDRPRRQG
jgi:hypothetical protein